MGSSSSIMGMCIDVDGPIILVVVVDVVVDVFDVDGLIVAVDVVGGLIVDVDVNGLLGLIGVGVGFLNVVDVVGCWFGCGLPFDVVVVFVLDGVAKVVVVLVLLAGVLGPIVVLFFPSIAFRSDRRVRIYGYLLCF